MGHSIKNNVYFDRDVIIISVFSDNIVSISELGSIKYEHKIEVGAS